MGSLWGRGTCVAAVVWQLSAGMFAGRGWLMMLATAELGPPIPRLLGSRTKPAAAVHTFNCGARLALRLGIWLPSPFDYLGQVTTA